MPSQFSLPPSVPMPRPRPDVQGVLDQARKEFPILKNQDYGYVENMQKGRGFLEHWPAGEPGGGDYPRPQGLPADKPGLEIYDPKTRPIDVMGDVASHQLIHTDPVVKAMYERLVNNLTPEQQGRQQDQYKYAQANEGETRPFDEWKKMSGDPAYFRGYPFQQWPAEFNEQAYTPEQRGDLDKMMDYLKR